VDDLEAGHETADLAEAQRYVENLTDEDDGSATGSTTSTSTSTTTAPTTAVPATTGATTP
jgi:hypothetical protein